MTRKILDLNDTTEFPPIHPSRVLPWQLFRKDFLGKDFPMNEAVKNCINDNPDEKLDLRPYINDNPMTVVNTDSILKCCELFRKMHLRHLCVIHPTTG